MTINQAIDKLSQVIEPNLAQQELKLSLQSFKFEFGGKTKIENVKTIESLIRFGNKEGIAETL